MKTLDTKALIGEVAARHGVTLKPDDPAFALVTLNHLVLEQAVAGLNEHAEKIAGEFEQSLARLETRTGSFVGTEVRKAAVEIRQSLRVAANGGCTDSNRPTHGTWGEVTPLMSRWVVCGLLSGVMLFALGFLTGWIWK
jgi:hypothetical protein